MFNMFDTCPRSVPGVSLTRIWHGYGFIVEVFMLHSTSLWLVDTWIHFQPSSNHTQILEIMAWTHLKLWNLKRNT